jgi:putative hydrolase of the HAD superfamily
MAAIRTVLWDIGGVLLTNGWDHREREQLFREFGIDKVAFEQRHPEANDQWEKGEISVGQYLDRVLFYEPRDFTPEQFLARMKDQSKWLENSAIEVLRSLSRSAQVSLGMLNNEARELNDYRIAKFGLRDLFQSFLSSCYVGMRKPDPKMFRLALDVFQTAPEETVFVDDRQGNADAAAALGIHAVTYAGPGQLRQELDRLGVSLS